MEEIKFKGKSEGNWVYGSYAKTGAGLHYIIPQNLISNQLLGYVVDKKSVGQYIGLKDKNGTEIYGGDILKGPTLYETPENTATTYSHWKITYGNCSFYLGDSPIDEDIDWVSEECEVVGNVYENPELLKK